MMNSSDEGHVMSDSLPRVYLARHGETAWTISRQHTGRTDIPLTARGEANARSLGERLKGETSSSSSSARSVALAGRASWPVSGPGPTRGRPARVELWRRRGPDDGRRSAPSGQGGTCFATAVPGGESVEAVGARADRVVARLKRARGRVILFGHGHFFRVLAARWLGLPPARRAISGSAPQHSAYSGMSIHLMNRPSSSGMTIATPRLDQPGEAATALSRDRQPWLLKGLDRMATRRTAAVETKKPTAPKPEHPTAKALLEQYECGPIAFSGVPGASVRAARRL